MVWRAGIAAPHKRRGTRARRGRRAPQAAGHQVASGKPRPTNGAAPERILSSKRPPLVILSAPFVILSASFVILSASSVILSVSEGSAFSRLPTSSRAVLLLLTVRRCKMDDNAENLLPKGTTRP